MTLVLASSSPRRERLLARIVRKFSVKAAKIDERIGRREPFKKAAERLALLKAGKVADGKSVVVGADTIAYLGRRNFRKTENVRAARRALLFLRGRTHIVITGVAVLFPSGSSRKGRDSGRCAFCRSKMHHTSSSGSMVKPTGKTLKYSVKAAVKMREFSDAELKGYLKSGEWKGRAGSYDISGKGAALVESVRGEKETVVGLPLKRLTRVLSTA